MSNIQPTPEQQPVISSPEVKGNVKGGSLPAATGKVATSFQGSTPLPKNVKKEPGFFTSIHRVFRRIFPALTADQKTTKKDAETTILQLNTHTSRLTEHLTRLDSFTDRLASGKLKGNEKPEFATDDIKEIRNQITKAKGSLQQLTGSDGFKQLVETRSESSDLKHPSCEDLLKNSEGLKEKIMAFENALLKVETKIEQVMTAREEFSRGIKESQNILKESPFSWKSLGRLDNTILHAYNTAKEIAKTTKNPDRDLRKIIDARDPTRDQLYVLAVAIYPDFKSSMDSVVEIRSKSLKPLIAGLEDKVKHNDKILKEFSQLENKLSDVENRIAKNIAKKQDIRSLNKEREATLTLISNVKVMPFDADEIAQIKNLAQRIPDQYGKLNTRVMAQKVPIKTIELKKSIGKQLLSFKEVITQQNKQEIVTSIKSLTAKIKELDNLTKKPASGQKGSSIENFLSLTKGSFPSAEPALRALLNRKKLVALFPDKLEKEISDALTIKSEVSSEASRNSFEELIAEEVPVNVLKSSRATLESFTQAQENVFEEVKEPLSIIPEPPSLPPPAIPGEAGSEASGSKIPKAPAFPDFLKPGNATKKSADILTKQEEPEKTEPKSVASSDIPPPPNIAGLLKPAKPINKPVQPESPPVVQGSNSTVPPEPPPSSLKAMPEAGDGRGNLLASIRVGAQLKSKEEREELEKQRLAKIAEDNVGKESSRSKPDDLTKTLEEVILSKRKGLKEDESVSESNDDWED